MELIYFQTCEHCKGYNTFRHDIQKEGWYHKCIGCGEDMLLCDACLAAEDNPRHTCNWYKGKCKRTEMKA